MPYFFEARSIPETVTYQTDTELITACRQGHAEAWDAVLDRYERLVYSIPLNYGLSRSDAADIAQITFTILLQRLETLRPNTTLAPWLATVARRHTWRLLEKRKRERPQRYQDLSEALVTKPDPDSGRTKERWERVQWLEQGLAQLDQRCRQLLLALYFSPEQPSYAEVADHLDIAVGSVGPTRARCLQRLRHYLNDLLA